MMREYNVLRIGTEGELLGTMLNGGIAFWSGVRNRGEGQLREIAPSLDTEEACLYDAGPTGLKLR